MQAVLIIFLAVPFIFYQSILTGGISDTGQLPTAHLEPVCLKIPGRPEGAETGEELAARLALLALSERESAVVQEVLRGNVPSFSRVLKPLTIRETIYGKEYQLTLFVSCDYLAIGSDSNYLYIPLTPSTAQLLANRLDCLLPTRKMVDLIYQAAEIKLRPQPISPSDNMITVPVFLQHTDSIRQQFSQLGVRKSAARLIAGHKKDIIISNKIYSSDREYDRVVIYGWHTGINHPIQPVYNGHHADWVDYSHGVRFVARNAILNGDTVLVDSLLKNPVLCPLISDEGVILRPYYPIKNDVLQK